MRFTRLTKPEEWNWFTKRTYATRSSDTQGIVAYDDTDKIVAVTVFDTFTVDSCCVHLAIDNPIVIRRGFLNILFEHAFIVCDRDRMFASVVGTNKKSINFIKRIGGWEVTRIPDGYAKGVDTVIMRMDRDGCRWINIDERAA